MEFKKFLKNGVLAVMMAATVTSALAQPINAMLQESPDRVEVAQIIKDSVPKEDLAYLIQKGPGHTDARVEKVYEIINKEVDKKYGNEHLQAIKKEIEKEVKHIAAYKNINVSYSWSIPKEILKDYPEAKQNDSSVAYSAMDISGECKVVMKLAIDDHGRLFEASELAGLTTKEVGELSSKKIIDVLKETISHEMSHCVLQQDMKNPNFEVSFSKDFKEQNPEIVKAINEKINTTKTQIEKKDFDNLNYFDYLMYSNYNENFADVSGAFARLGNNPNEATIKEVKGGLLELAKFRESTGLTHKTNAAVQYALEKVEDAAKMTPEARIEFAKEIAGDSLLNNMKVVFNRMIKINHSGVLSSYLVNGVKIDENNMVTQEVPEGTDDQYEKIVNEYEAMEDGVQKLGSVNQKIYSHQELFAKYNYKENNDNQNNQNISFNQVAFLEIRNRALKPIEEKIKLKA